MLKLSSACAVQKERRSRPRSFTRFNRYSEENKNYGCSETYADGTPELFNDLRISIGNNEMSRSAPRRLTGFAQEAFLRDQILALRPTVDDAFLTITALCYSPRPPLLVLLCYKIPEKSVGGFAVVSRIPSPIEKRGYQPRAGCQPAPRALPVQSFVTQSIQGEAFPSLLLCCDIPRLPLTARASRCKCIVGTQ
jgi:hypothetical protein